jgi:hypothetical protein
VIESEKLTSGTDVFQKIHRFDRLEKRGFCLVFCKQKSRYLYEKERTIAKIPILEHFWVASEKTQTEDTVGFLTPILEKREECKTQLIFQIF